MTTFSICSSCSTHIRAGDATCPFCGVVRECPTSAPSRGAKLAVIAATVVSMLSITACGYGLSPRAPDARGLDAHALDARLPDAHVSDAHPSDAHPSDAHVLDAPHADAN